jgi:hypothetical protein
MYIDLIVINEGINVYFIPSPAPVYVAAWRPVCGGYVVVRAMLSPLLCPAPTNIPHTI